MTTPLEDTLPRRLSGGTSWHARARVVGTQKAQIFDFTLDGQAMAHLDALEEGLVTGWDPAEQR